MKLAFYFKSSLIIHSNFQKIGGFRWFFEYGFNKFASIEFINSPQKPLTNHIYKLFNMFAKIFAKYLIKIWKNWKMANFSSKLSKDYTFFIDFLKCCKLHTRPGAQPPPNPLRGDPITSPSWMDFAPPDPPPRKNSCRANAYSILLKRSRSFHAASTASEVRSSASLALQYTLFARSFVHPVRALENDSFWFKTL